MTDGIKPWERQPYESASDYVAFSLYLQQDPARSLNEAYRRYRAQKGNNTARLAPGSWRMRAAGKRQSGEKIEGALTWEARALAWDDHIAELEQKKWIERRLELKEREWEVGAKLLQRGSEMLAFPVITTESADGATVIMPAGWKMRDIPQVLSTGSKLARLAADMATENIDVVDWREEARKEGFDPDELFSKLVTEFSARLDGGGDAGGLERGESESANQEG